MARNSFCHGRSEELKTSPSGAHQVYVDGKSADDQSAQGTELCVQCTVDDQEIFTNYFSWFLWEVPPIEVICYTLKPIVTRCPAVKVAMCPESRSQDYRVLQPGSRTTRTFCAEKLRGTPTSCTESVAEMSMVSACVVRRPHSPRV